MDLDDEFDNRLNQKDLASQHGGSTMDKGAEGAVDPMEISNPSSAYFFLSDDAQDEITGTGKKKMKCDSCGHRFTGEIYDRCPKCDSLNTEEVLSFIGDEDEGGDVPNMKCLGCGHAFVGDIYDRCPECFSSDTEQMTGENDDGYW